MKHPIEEEIRAHQHYSLERDLIINTTGSIGAGKSTFLGAVHEKLGYASRGINITRGRMRSAKGPNELRQRGIHRGNATVLCPDLMPVYGFTSEGNITILLAAPGGHAPAPDIDSEPDVLVYFLDISVLNKVHQIFQRLNNGFISEIDFFPYKKGWFHPEDLEYIDSYPARVRHSLFTSKGDQLGLLVESLLAAQLKVEEARCKGIPVVGVQTYDCNWYTKQEDSGSGIKTSDCGWHTQPQDDQFIRQRSCKRNRDLSEEWFNRLVKAYLKYLDRHGVPEYFQEQTEGEPGTWRPRSETLKRQTFQHTEGITAIRLRDLVQEWYQLDSLSEDKRGVIEALHGISVRGLNRRGIDSSDFLLYRFVKRTEEMPLTIYYSA